MTQDVPAIGLQVNGVSKSYGEVEVLSGIDLQVRKGDFHALLGASGSGKTTLLRTIAGFLYADQGTISIDGVDVSNTPPEQRDVGFVFQNYALFPHLTVFENVAFGLSMRKVPKAEIRDRVMDALALVRLNTKGIANRRPRELSGGQQQRVALARALVINPAVLLLDEPLSALDRKVRQEVREELKRIQSETSVTTVLVTHDQDEALFLADRILVLEAGSFRQEDTPTGLYGAPVDSFIAGFVGLVNLLPATMDWASTPQIATVEIGTQTVSRPVVAREGMTADSAESWTLGIRPEQFTVTRLATGDSSEPGLDGVVTEIVFVGATANVVVDVEGLTLTAMVLSPAVFGADGIAVGDRVRLGIPAEAMLLPADSSGEGGLDATGR